jgi:hypothetical protein
MLSEENKNILLNQLHADIQSTAIEVLQAIDNNSIKNRIHYPPGVPFSSEETLALSDAIQKNPTLRASIEKLLKGAVGSVLFDFFNYIDGTGDPADPKWGGVLLIDRKTDIEFDSHLHDDFFASAPTKLD